MIRIKDYIFNENKIIQMCINEENNLEIDVDNGFPRVIKNVNFSDIEWNYEDEQIRKCLESIDREEELENKIKELEEENKKLKDKIYKIEELVDAYEKAEEIIGVGKPRFPLYKLQKILGEE